jgi:hypothetical protein
MKVSKTKPICGRRVHASTHRIHPYGHTLSYLIPSPLLFKICLSYPLVYAQPVYINIKADKNGDTV